MKRSCLCYLALMLIMIVSISCKMIVPSVGSHEQNSAVTVKPKIESYNEYTMELDPDGVTYTIDISTNEGKLKLKDLTLLEAEQLAVVECLIKYNCATLFNPQYTHLKKGKDILRVTVFGFPARYKRTPPTQDIEEEYIEETEEAPERTVTKTKTTRKSNTPAHSQKIRK